MNFKVHHIQTQPGSFFHHVLKEALERGKKKLMKFCRGETSIPASFPHKFFNSFPFPMPSASTNAQTSAWLPPSPTSLLCLAGSVMGVASALPQARGREIVSTTRSEKSWKEDWRERVSSAVSASISLCVIVKYRSISFDFLMGRNEPKSERELGDLNSDFPPSGDFMSTALPVWMGEAYGMNWIPYSMKSLPPFSLPLPIPNVDSSRSSAQVVHCFGCPKVNNLWWMVHSLRISCSKFLIKFWPTAVELYHMLRKGDGIVFLAVHLDVALRKK